MTGAYLDDELIDALGAGLPASLEAHLVPDPLARLAGQIEQLPAEEQVADAVQTARATLEMLQHAVSRAAESDPDLADLSGQLGRIRHNLDTIDVAG
jgi:hypothetical protein